MIEDEQIIDRGEPIVFFRTLPNGTIRKCTTITEKEWNTKISKEPPDAIHHCDHFHIGFCDCKGSCSCHWKEEELP